MLKTFPVYASALHRTARIRTNNPIITVWVNPAVSFPTLPASGIALSDGQTIELSLRMHRHPAKSMFDERR